MAVEAIALRAGCDRDDRGVDTRSQLRPHASLNPYSGTLPLAP